MSDPYQLKCPGSKVGRRVVSLNRTHGAGKRVVLGVVLFAIALILGLLE